MMNACSWNKPDHKKLIDTAYKAKEIDQTDRDKMLLLLKLFPDDFYLTIRSVGNDIIRTVIEYGVGIRIESNFKTNTKRKVDTTKWLK